MDGNAPPFSDVSHHGVTRHRLAALGVADHEAVDAVNFDSASKADPVNDPTEAGRLGRPKLLGRLLREHRLNDLSGRRVAPSQDLIHGVHRADGQARGRTLEHVGGRHV